MPDPETALATFEADLQKAHEDAVVIAAPRVIDTGPIVDAWFTSTMHNSIISRSTETYNHVYAAVQELKARLVKELMP